MKIKIVKSEFYFKNIIVLNVKRCQQLKVDSTWLDNNNRKLVLTVG